MRMCRQMNSPGILMVVSGPSGAGKSTVIKTLLQKHESFSHPLFFSVSSTTRAPRPGEVDGADYHFVTNEAFEDLLMVDGFLEHASYAGCHYGTPLAPVQASLKQGGCVLLDIEVQGAMQVKRRCPSAVLVFLMPPTWQELERRLRSRKSEPEDKILRRLTIAFEEFEFIDAYDYIIFNHSVEKAADQLAAIVKAECCRVRRQLPWLEEV